MRGRYRVRRRPKRENAESLKRDLLSAGAPLIINAANIFLAARRQRQTSQDSEIMTRYHVAINRQGNYSHGRASVRAYMHIIRRALARQVVRRRMAARPASERIGAAFVRHFLPDDNDDGMTTARRRHDDVDDDDS